MASIDMIFYAICLQQLSSCVQVLRDEKRFEVFEEVADEVMCRCISELFYAQKTESSFNVSVKSDEYKV